jgi:hypothetical protein
MRLSELAADMSGVNGFMDDRRIVGITTFAKQWELSNCTCMKFGAICYRHWRLLKRMSCLS